MDILSFVSETALITLKSRAVESEKKRPVLEDAAALDLFNRLQSFLPIEIRNRLLNRKLPSVLTRCIALRTRKYDSYTRKFLEKYPDGLVVNLGCGFDTRYWRIYGEPWKYIEIDLPNVIDAKRKVLNDIVPYPMIGCSVLHEYWIEKILSIQNEHVLFLSEGLFMYLPKDGVINLFKRLAKVFVKSEIAFDVVNEKYTKGLWKKIVTSKMRTLGTQAGFSFDFGIHDSKDVEAYGDNVKVVEEWFYIEDGDIKPKILKLFRNVKQLSKIGWTIKVTIN